MRKLLLFAVAAFATGCSEATTGPASDPALRESGGFGTQTAVAGETIYAVTSANELISFTAGSSVASTSLVISGLGGETAVGIDFRPNDLLHSGPPQSNTGKLYAITSGSRVCIIDVATGAASKCHRLTSGGAPVTLSGSSFGIGFNPVVDRIRVHSDADQNLRVNPDDGVTAVDATLAYSPGDRHDGRNPTIVGTGYTNNDADPATGTTLYGIDVNLDLLVGFGPGGPNSGQLVTIGSLVGVRSDDAGFDISNATGIAYASLILHPGSPFPAGPGLFSVNLGTGAATRLGGLPPTSQRIVSIAVAPGGGAPPPPPPPPVVANGKIVFKSGNDEIWTVNPDGSGLTQLTAGYGTSTCLSGDEEPKWSPDGTKIVFSRTQDGSQEIWTMNANGTNQTKLTSTGNGLCDDNGAAATFSENPSWSPDGTKIIFTSDRSTTAVNEDLWIMNANGSGQTKLFGAPGTQESEAVFSPDGTTIAYQLEQVDSSGSAISGEIWLLNSDGTNPRRLTTSAAGNYDENLAWSPDGQKIAFTQNTTTTGDAVAIINANGTGRAILAPSGERPSFSPDGTKIAYGTSADAIGIMNPDGTGQTTVPLGTLTSNGQPNWQPVFIAPVSH